MHACSVHVCVYVHICMCVFCIVMYYIHVYTRVYKCTHTHTYINAFMRFMKRVCLHIHGTSIRGFIKLYKSSTQIHDIDKG